MRPPFPFPEEPIRKSSLEQRHPVVPVQPQISQRDQMAAVIDDIERERLRQVEREGWTPAHDDAHAKGELARAAGSYLIYGDTHPETPPSTWPWDWGWWKPKESRRNRIIRALAMGVAEIERGDRKYGRGKW